MCLLWFGRLVVSGLWHWCRLEGLVVADMAVGVVGVVAGVLVDNIVDVTPGWCTGRCGVMMMPLWY
jgi:hypothetical protein